MNGFAQWISYWCLILALTGLVTGIVLLFVSFKRTGLMRYVAISIVTGVVLLFVVATLRYLYS